MRCETVDVSNLQFPTETGGYPEPSKASTALVFGILGVVLFSIFAPFALVMANREIAAIEAGRRSPDGLSSAKAARVLGWVGIGLFLATLVFVALLIGGVLVLDGLNP